jgi:hypothetical protein
VRPVSASLSIDAPRERIFDLLIDLSIRPAFSDRLFTDFRLGRLKPVGVGASARYRLEGVGWMDTVIDQAERPYLVREHGMGGRTNRVPAFTVWELAEGPSRDGSEVTVTFWTEPSSLFDKARDLTLRSRRLRREFRRMLAGLRELAESERTIERVRLAGADRLPAFNR